MKKLFAILAVIATIACACFAFVACNKDTESVSYVAIDATDLLQEDFGIAVTKGNSTLLNAVNAVIDEWNANGNMTLYSDYYTALAEEETSGQTAVAPEGLKLSWTPGNGGVIKVYTESGFAPYEFLYNDAVVGLDIAIMSQVAENLGKTIEVCDVLFDSIPTYVSTAEGDAVGAAGMTINDERKESVDFSNVYASSTLVVVSTKDASISSVKDLAGKKVGVQEGTSGDLIISAAITSAGYKYENEDEQEVVVKAVGASVVQYKTYAAALADLKAGRIDAILMDKIPATILIASI